MGADGAFELGVQMAIIELETLPSPGRGQGTLLGTGHWPIPGALPVALSAHLAERFRSFVGGHGLAGAGGLTRLGNGI
jgi:hypothetical protein